MSAVPFIRDATPDDAPFLAKCVMSAAHMYDFPLRSPYDVEFSTICSRSDTLYSFRRTRVITVGGTAVGCLISYPGDIYEKAREVTFPLFTDVTPEQKKRHLTGTETYPGEWYLDSLAILPGYRKFGLGTMLIKDALAIARRKGFKVCTLIVEKAKPALHDYYKSLGFELENDILFFGEQYVRMVKKLL